MTRRRWYQLAAALVCCACAPAASKQVPATATVTAEIATVTSEQFSGVIDAIGTVTVRPGHIASLGAPGAGRVTAVRVAVGDRVGAGAVLVELDPAPFDAVVTSAAAALQSATRAQERAQRLVDAGISPRKDLDLATNELAQATSAASSARRLRNLATLRSPISGVVTRLVATLGASVDGTSSLVEVADPRAVDVTLAVSATEAAQIRTGARVLLTAGAGDAADTLGTGTINSIAAAIDTATRTVSVRASVSGATRPLRIGESVNGRIALDTRAETVLVPAAAVVPDGDEYRVFVLDTTNVARVRTVEVGARRDGRIEITSGLKPGERIVTAGAYQVDDGVHIVVKQR